jgi:hypothetical protein
LRTPSYARAALLRGEGSFGSGGFACKTAPVVHATGGDVGRPAELGLEKALRLEEALDRDGDDGVGLDEVTGGRSAATTAQVPMPMSPPMRTVRPATATRLREGISS